MLHTIYKKFKFFDIEEFWKITNIKTKNYKINFATNNLNTCKDGDTLKDASSSFFELFKLLDAYGVIKLIQYEAFYFQPT